MAGSSDSVKLWAVWNGDRWNPGVRLPLVELDHHGSVNVAVALLEWVVESPGEIRGEEPPAGRTLRPPDFLHLAREVDGQPVIILTTREAIALLYTHVERGIPLDEVAKVVSPDKPITRERVRHITGVALAKLRTAREVQARGR